MTDEEIAALVRSDESDRVERKESLTDRVRRAICAFANDLAGHGRPSVVIIGQRDDRSCVNLAIDERFRQDYLPNAVAPDVLEENHRELVH
jgi:ATP-dependent DNA helicase RecG